MVRGNEEIYLLCKQKDRSLLQSTPAAAVEEPNHIRKNYVKFIGALLKALGVFSVNVVVNAEQQTSTKKSPKKQSTCKFGFENVGICIGLIASALHKNLFGDTIGSSRKKRIITEQG